MRKTVSLSVLLIASVGVILTFVPAVYNSAVPPDCSLFCATSGSSANYRSVSAQLLGQGATYWVVSQNLTRYCIVLWVFKTPGCADSYAYFGSPANASTSA